MSRFQRVTPSGAPRTTATASLFCPAGCQVGRVFMSKLFQIHENDLVTLEADIPQLADALMPVMNNRLRVQIRRVQKILSDVRWNYGPPTDVEEIPA